MNLVILGDYKGQQLLMSDLRWTYKQEVILWVRPWTWTEVWYCLSTDFIHFLQVLLHITNKSSTTCQIQWLARCSSLFKRIHSLLHLRLWKWTRFTANNSWLRKRIVIKVFKKQMKQWWHKENSRLVYKCLFVLWSRYFVCPHVFCLKIQIQSLSLNIGTSTRDADSEGNPSALRVILLILSIATGSLWHTAHYWELFKYVCFCA